jgi:hypothetical protein
MAETLKPKMLRVKCLHRQATSKQRQANLFYLIRRRQRSFFQPKD